MDSQRLFNVVVGVAAFLAVFVFNSMASTINKLQDKFEALPMNYVAKSDFRNDLSEIKASLKQISDKLDSKVDKSRQ